MKPPRPAHPVRVALPLAAALALASPAVHATIELGPAVAPLGPGRVSIAWTADEATPMVLRVAATGRVPHDATSATADGVHRVTLEGLEPGIEYRYAVGGRRGRFVAPPDGNQEVHFAVFGDTRDGDAAHQTIVERVAAARPDFYLLTGDILVDGDSVAAWRRFFAIERPLMTATAFTSVRGNHDGEGSDFGRLVTPQSGSGDANASFGSMSLGPAHFVLVDTEQSLAPGSPQYAFLERDLAANADRPLMVLLHKPLFSTGVHGSHASVQRNLAPLLQRYGVDVVFQGHDHFYERSEAINGVTYVVSGGGGAPLYGAARASWVQASESAYHYLLVDASATRIHVAAHRLDGSQLDSFDVDPRANNGGRYATATRLPASSGGCIMVLLRPGPFRRGAAEHVGAATSTLGPLLGYCALRGTRRRRRRERERVAGETHPDHPQG